MVSAFRLRYAIYRMLHPVSLRPTLRSCSAPEFCMCDHVLRLSFGIFNGLPVCRFAVLKWHIEQADGDGEGIP